MKLIEIVVREFENGGYVRSITLPLKKNYSYEQVLQAIYCLEIKQIHKKERRGEKNAREISHNKKLSESIAVLERKS